MEKTPPCVRVALVVIFAAAAFLRFYGLSWGLRHAPSRDERVFVESGAWMVASRDLDHRFYLYPGFFIYLLAPALAFCDPPEVGARGYLAARGVVAAFGVASVALTYTLARRLSGFGAGLAAAALLAVSPLEVRTAHMVRPDIALETFTLLALLAFTRVGAAPAGDVWSGIGIGAATAIKFSGMLVAPSYVVQRLAAGGFAWRRVLLAALLSVATFFALSPFFVVRPDTLWRGVESQLEYHYQELPSGSHGYLAMLVNYAHMLQQALGTVGLLLAVAGLILSQRAWRRFAGPAALPIVTIAVLSTAEVSHRRFVVLTLGVLAMFAGHAVARAGRGRAWLGALLTLAAVAVPVKESLEYSTAVARPSTYDRTVDWIGANVPEGGRVLTTIPDLGVDRTRYEMLTLEHLNEGTLNYASYNDAVVVGPKDDPATIARFERRFVAAPEGPYSGFEIQVLAPGVLRPLEAPVPLMPGNVRVSENEGLAAALFDSDLGTFWQAKGPQSPGSFIEITLPRAETVGRIELRHGRRVRGYARKLQVLVSDDGAAWRHVRVFQGRRPVGEQARNGAASQVLIFDPVRTRHLRLEQVGWRAKRWEIAELVVFAREGGAQAGRP